jgi:ribose 5-phosphate isomerase B
MKIYFAADHAGFELKNTLLAYVRDELKHEVEDCGAYELDEGDDYPDFISIAADKVSEDKGSRAVILGGSGQGEAIVANRYRGIRAVVYYGGNAEILRLSREHNDSNVLSLGARFLGEEEAKKAVGAWLEAPFSGEERHLRRLREIDASGD